MSFAEDRIEGGWIIDGTIYETNPTRDLDPDFLEVVDLWRTCRPRPGVMRGMVAGHIPSAPVLPEAGGLLDQGAWLQHAFDVLDEAYSVKQAGAAHGD